MAEKKLRAKRKNEFYPTPNLLAYKICDYMHGLLVSESIVPEAVIEPSAGSGAFVTEILKHWGDCQTIAIEPHKTLFKKLRKSTGVDEAHNVTWEDFEREGGYPNPVLVIGNPPFSKAVAHIDLSLSRLPPKSYVAFLLRLSFLGSLDRATNFWRRRLESLRYVVPLAPRPQFVEGTSDNSEYALYIWQVGCVIGPTIKPHIIWKDT